MSFFSNLTSGLNQPSSLRFPVDKVEDYDDYVQFTVYKYQPPYRKTSNALVLQVAVLMVLGMRTMTSLVSVLVLN